MAKRPCDSSGRRLAYRLLRRVYAILRSGEWSVAYVKMLDNPKVCNKLDLDPRMVGMLDTAEQIIFVDFREDVLATVVHECIHIILEPRELTERAEEKETQRLEKLVMRHMSRCQAMRLHHLIGLRLRYI